MNWRGIHLSEPARLCLKQRQLQVEQAGDVRSLPLEDMAFLVIDTPQATLSAALLAACAEYGCLVITTNERHMPNGALLPFNPYYRQAETLDAQIAFSEPKKKRLWQRIIRQKICNQATCLALLGRERRLIQRVAVLEQKVRSGDPDNVEGGAARLYWSAIAPSFMRDTEGADRLNAMLNYGYALVRALIARELAAYGFAPALGVHHRNKQNAFNLADDIIEPWRPVVDWLAIRHWQTTREQAEFCIADKRHMTGIFYEPVAFNGGEQTLLDAVKKQMEQLRPCYLGYCADLPCPAFPVHTGGEDAS